MKAIPNEHEISLFALSSRYMVSRDPDTGGPYAGIVELEWAGPTTMSPVEFEKRLVKLERGDITPDALLALLFQELTLLLQPVALRVRVSVETIKHGSYALTKEGGESREEE